MKGLAPMFRWFGSKWSGAKHYPSPIGGSIYEPFAGGAGYSLRHYDQSVYLQDADPLVEKLWRWLIQASSNDVLSIPVDVPEGTDIRTIGLSEGQALLMKCWQRTNNVGDCWTVSAWNGKPGLWSISARSRTAEQVNAIRHWRVEEPSNVASCTVFVDPPYQYNYKYRASLPQLNYPALGEVCKDIAAVAPLVIACEAVGKNGEMPTYLPFRASHMQVTSRRKAEHSHHAQELIWVGGRCA